MIVFRDALVVEKRGSGVLVTSQRYAGDDG